MFEFYSDSKTTLLSGLKSMNASQLQSTIYKINKHTVSLDLGWNDLGNMVSEELAGALIYLSENITSIDFRGNNLQKQTGKDTALIFSSLKHATHVALSFTNLSKHNNLAEALNGFKFTQVTSLDISDNNLGFQDNVQLLPAIAALLKIVSLNMRDNKLDHKKEQDLQALFSAFSHKLSHLNISNNNLANKLKAIKYLPENIISLNISGNAVNKLSPEEIEELQNPFVHIQTLYLSYDEVKEMSREQKDTLKRAISKIKNVVYINSQEKEMTLTSFPFEQSENEVLGNTLIARSLNQAGFFVKDKLQKVFKSAEESNLYNMSKD